MTEPLANEITGLCGLTRADLIERWIEIHGSAPNKTMTKDLLVRGIAYAIQEQQHGGLTRGEKKALAALAQGNATLKIGRRKPGTRLYRSWRGITHEVLVLEDGYGWQARTYASLSEVARAITGTRWSGPRFFGLKV